MSLHEWIPLFNTALLMVAVWAFHRISRGWTIPKQNALLQSLRADLDATSISVVATRRDVDGAHHKADALGRELEHDRRNVQDNMDALLREVRSVGAQVSTLLSMRDELHSVAAQATALERDLTSLVCFEDTQLRKQQLPGFCPLRKVPCPLDTDPATVVKEEDAHGAQ